MKRIIAVILALSFIAASLSSCAKKELTMVTVSTKPIKTWYYEGETFDPAGLAITAKYSDGSEEIVTDYEVDATKALTTEDRAVKVSFGGKSAMVPITVDYAGNGPEYNVENTPVLDNSPLEGKTYFFLGSSVTYGDTNEDGSATSMVEFIAKRNSCTVIKEAVSGTSLALVEGSAYGKNYTVRLDEYITSPERAQHLDGFVCQLSTNDVGQVENFGIITANDVRDASQFDIATTYGAIEYIIATVKDVWDCPIAFYTNCRYSAERYGELVDSLHKIAEKWEVEVIDLWTPEDFNDISEAQRALYLKTDGLHPTKAGYREWWLPEFEKVLAEF